jgi:hypothetical protein
MTILKKLEAAMPGLEMLIEVHYGVNVKGRMKVTAEENRSNNITYRIQSDSLTDMLSPFTRLIFRDIQFYFWGGEVSDMKLRVSKNRVWFSPKVSYVHVAGGSNGCDVMWTSLCFDLETGQWITKG